MKEERIIDRIVFAPYDASSIKEKNIRWFGINENITHAKNGQNVYPTLYGFDSCRGEYILQMDSDVLIGCQNDDHDVIAEMIDSIESNPEALFVSFNIMNDRNIEYTSSGPNGDWRVEVRNCLLKKSRIDTILPIHNDVEDENFSLPWHRAFDSFIQDSQYQSLRGGNKQTYFIHVPNERKSDPNEMLMIMERIENGEINPQQYGNVDLVGEWDDWIQSKRVEPFIFIICTCNVESGKFKSCWESLINQSRDDWGALIIDGNSSNGLQDYIEFLIKDYSHKVTFVKEKERKGVMYSTWVAITKFCSNPESVIITLDGDDALIGQNVIERVKKEYDLGADVTVGSMLRVDKEIEYPVDFENPRENGGGNVWQHLRTFKKKLFDRIRVEDLKIEGEWVNIATDWLFMLPIVEMASHPVHIEEKLYYYDPGPEKDPRRKVREEIISKIVAKPTYKKE